MERYEQAVIRLQARSGYRVTIEELEDERRARPAGAILDRGASYWQRFVKDGQLDRKAVLAKKYRESQLDHIEAEMVRLGWLEK